MATKSTLRIVSLAPSASSILCAIGAKKFLVGVTKWCPAVAPVLGIPKLGDCWHMHSLEDLLALRPTLVIGSVPYKQETVAKLLQQPFVFLAMNPRSLADVYADIHLLGGITGHIKQANAVARRMQGDLQAVARRAKPRSRKPRVYCEAWPNPRISSPPWVAELVSLAGGETVLPSGEKLTDERVAKARPDIIVLAWAATGAKAKTSKAYSAAVWKDLPAIRHRRVFVVSDELLNTPAPPLVQGARELAALLKKFDAGAASA
jgi:iron complex transport system substrate-binding protein